MHIESNEHQLEHSITLKVENNTAKLQASMTMHSGHRCTRAKYIEIFKLGLAAYLFAEAKIVKKLLKTKS